MNANLSPRFSATLQLDSSVARDWTAAEVQQLAGLESLVAALPKEIDSVRFYSHSGEGMPSRSIAYNDLWVSVARNGGEPQSQYLTNSLEAFLDAAKGPYCKALLLMEQLGARFLEPAPHHH